MSYSGLGLFGPQLSTWEARITITLRMCLSYWLGGTLLKQLADALVWQPVARDPEDDPHADVRWRLAVVEACASSIFQTAARSLPGLTLPEFPSTSSNSVGVPLCPFELSLPDQAVAPPVVDAAVQAFELFQTVLVRPSSRAAITKEYCHLVVVSFLEINHVLASLLLLHENPPAPQGFPYHAGQVSWVQSLQKRMDAVVLPVCSMLGCACRRVPKFWIH
jgi:hypothetical protein